MKVNRFYKLALIFTGLSFVSAALSQKGRKAGSNPIDGNPIRDKFKALYGTDEDGFVQRAIDYYNKSNQPAL